MNTNVFGNVRFYLWAALALVLFYDYEAWMKDYAPPPRRTTSWRRPTFQISPHRSQRQ